MAEGFWAGEVEGVEMTFSWKQKRVMITGASGLVGSHLTEKLIEEKAEITCLVRDYVPDSRFFLDGMDKRVNIVRGSLEEYWTLERMINEYEPEIVFHLGAQALVPMANRSPLPTFEANVRGTWNLLEACRMHKEVGTIVVASSDKAYGQQKKLPYTEDMPLEGGHPYDASKSCADLIARSFAKTYGMPVTVSRCGNFFGEGDLNFNRLVPGTIRSLYHNKSPMIRSDGEYIRDYIYVKDAVSAYLALAQGYNEEIRGEAFNFSTEKKLTVLEIVSMISKLMGKEGIKPTILNQQISEIREQHLSSEKARNVLGWKPEYGIETGLERTIKWYKELFESKE